MEKSLENHSSLTHNYSSILDDLMDFKEHSKIEEMSIDLMEDEMKKLCDDYFESFSNMDFEEVDKDLRIHKELMKLTFDLWKDFSYFSSFSFKGKYNYEGYTKGLERLQYTYEHGQWTSPSRVTNQQLIENIRKYIICYAVWNQKRRMLSSQYCTYCDAYLNYSSCCGHCNCSINDMGSISILEDNNQLLQNYADVEDRWTCKTCKEYNDFKMISCSKCQNPGPHYGKWLCDRCHYINSPSAFVCSVCYETNNYLKPCAFCQDIQINSKFDVICHCCQSKCIGNWMCRDPHNHRIYGTASMQCMKCKIIPIEPPEKSVTVSVNDETTGSIIERWKCTFCKELIEIDKDHCDYCLNLRYCDNRILCFYCGIVNESQDKFCAKCRKNLFKNEKIFEIDI